MTVIYTVAGNGNQGYAGDRGKATDAEMDLSLIHISEPTRPY